MYTYTEKVYTYTHSTTIYRPNGVVYIMKFKRGIDKEREVVRWLINQGFMAVRCAGSGGGTKLPRPDIIAGDGLFHYAIELKSSKADVVYISADQVAELKQFCAGFGAIPLVCANFTYMSPVFVKPERLSITKGLNYKISRQDIKKGLFSDLRSPAE